MIQTADFTKWLDMLLAETFGVSGTPFGYFLDDGSSGLLAAIKTPSAETVSAEAEYSQPLAPGRATIAGHCAHVLFILRLFDAYEQGQKPNEDWVGLLAARVDT